MLQGGTRPAPAFTSAGRLLLPEPLIGGERRLLRPYPRRLSPLRFPPEEQPRSEPPWVFLGGSRGWGLHREPPVLVPKGLRGREPRSLPWQEEKECEGLVPSIKPGIRGAGRRSRSVVSHGVISPGRALGSARQAAGRFFQAKNGVAKAITLGLLGWFCTGTVRAGRTEELTATANTARWLSRRGACCPHLLGLPQGWLHFAGAPVPLLWASQSPKPRVCFCRAAHSCPFVSLSAPQATISLLM